VHVDCTWNSRWWGGRRRVCSFNDGLECLIQVLCCSVWWNSSRCFQDNSAVTMPAAGGPGQWDACLGPFSWLALCRRLKNTKTGRNQRGERSLAPWLGRDTAHVLCPLTTVNLPWAAEATVFPAIMRTLEFLENFFYCSSKAHKCSSKTFCWLTEVASTN
jgi:hypothetical protein